MLDSAAIIKSYKKLAIKTVPIDFGGLCQKYIKTVCKISHRQISLI